MRRSAQLSADEVRQMIGAALAGSDGGQLLHRLDCVMLVARGRSCQEVADWFGVDRRTVQRWVHNAYARGLQGLMENHRGGRPGLLSERQLQQVRCDLQLPPAQLGYGHRQWSGKLLALHLHSAYKVEISVRTCQRMIEGRRSGPLPAT